MSKRKLKTHVLAASATQIITLCGKVVDGITGSPLNQDGTVPANRIVTAEPTCRTCGRMAEDEEQIDE